eukprot:GHVN01068378.1.p1 GENE.GHVN01068378.1~~GHVN01068378.1.p1  ORF type:complete len:371 (-),score=47.41 GHVN01068378.1:1457-2569(-)
MPEQPAPPQAPLTLLGIAYVEFYVSSAKQAAFYFNGTLGFQPVGYRGLETGSKDVCSYHLQQGKTNLIVTSSYCNSGRIPDFVKTHGDGVGVIAFGVADARLTHALAVERGAQSFTEPYVEHDERGWRICASICAYGDTIHTFVDSSSYEGDLMPYFQPITWESAQPPVGLERLDHVVANVDVGKMEELAAFYANVFGFQKLLSFKDKDIATAKTALQSTVMVGDAYELKFPINEPQKGDKKSQIQEFLDFNCGPGCQHVALTTPDIVKTVTEMRRRGCEFLQIDDAYYEELPNRAGEINEAFEDLKRNQILLDRDEKGYLLQIFTKPLGDRPTFFLEIIQRCGSESFGKGNFLALFRSIELEQSLRGTL